MESNESEEEEEDGAAGEDDGDDNGDDTLRAARALLSHRGKGRDGENGGGSDLRAIHSTQSTAALLKAAVNRGVVLNEVRECSCVCPSLRLCLLVD